VLLVNNTAGSGTGSGAVSISGGMLAGTGIISGSVTVSSGGILAPGNSLGTLTISNNLTLASGSVTLVRVQHSPLTNSAVKVSGTLTEGGTLNVTNSSAFAAGDSFKIFNAGIYSGAFAGFNLPSLPAGLAWNTSAMNESGTLSVVALTSPVINRLKILNGNLVVSGMGGPDGMPYDVQVTTNLIAAEWTSLSTNQFDSGGNFVFTNAVSPSSPQSYYRLQLP
jgi:hypothetical protein